MIKFSKFIWILLICILFAWFIRQALFISASEKSFTTESEQTHREYYFELFDIETVRHPSIESTYPDRANPNEEQDIVDLQHRVDIIPFSQDKNRNWYIVYPKHWVVTPLSTPSYSDTQKIRNGEMFNHYPYLDEWGLHYWWKDPSEGEWNMVIAAHSSYIKSEPWRYKTNFQVLPISTSWDSIFVYLKNGTWTYDLYTYVITESFRTHITDTSILHQVDDKKILTTYGCYIIWDNSERWVNQAELESVQRWFTLWSEKDNSKDTVISHDYEAKVIKPSQIPNIDTKDIHNSSTSKIQMWEENTKSVEIQGEIIKLENKLSSTLVVKIKELVTMIEQRLVTEPHLTELVYNRLNKKIIALEMNKDYQNDKAYVIYKLIQFYMESN